MKFMKILARRIEKRLMDFLANYKMQTEKSIGAVLSLATGLNSNIALIWLKNCEKHRKSVIYCNFIESLKNSTSDGTKNLKEMNETRENITAQAIANKTDELQIFLGRKFMLLDLEYDKLDCYTSAAQSNTENTKASVDISQLGNLSNETLVEFIERMFEYQVSIVDKSKLIVANYRNCIASDDAKKCLETFAEVNCLALTIILQKYFLLY